MGQKVKFQKLAPRLSESYIFSRNIKITTQLEGRGRHGGARDRLVPGRGARQGARLRQGKFIVSQDLGKLGRRLHPTTPTHPYRGMAAVYLYVALPPQLALRCVVRKFGSLRGPHDHFPRQSINRLPHLLPHHPPRFESLL